MIQWLVTAPHPRGPRFAHRGDNADDGRRGWKRHAVEADDRETFGAIARRRAVCGLIPRHGWTIDLFQDGMDKCERCARVAEGGSR